MTTVESRRERLAKSCLEIQQLINEAGTVFIGADDEALGKLCDRYTESTRELAKVLLEERIRRSLRASVDEESGKSQETGAEKVIHARTIRNWLSPWNFGFQDKSVHLPAQLGSSTTKQYGAYRMQVYGNPDVCKWSFVRESLTDPTLVDVTDFVHHSGFHKK